MDSKIWFVYLTDHHEGPFTPEEVAAMVAAGTVNQQTLGWKDGMAEWIPIESIAELKGALEAPAPAAAPVAAVAPMASAPAAFAPEASVEPDGNFSLAEMLARQQGGDQAAAPADPLAAFAAAPAAPAYEAPAAFAGAEGSPGPDEPAWTLRVNAQVSGLYTLNQLRDMYASGDVPPQAMLWHGGWTDFQPVSAVPEIKSGGQGGGFAAKRPAGPATTAAPAGRRPVFAPITAAADPAEDFEKTDTGIEAPPAGRGAGLKNLLLGFKERLNRKKAAPAPRAEEKSRNTQPSFVKGKGKVAPKGTAASIKRVMILVAFFALLGGGGFAYLKFFASPIPSELDVLPDDMELLKEAAKAPAAGGGKLHLASAKGTEENPADENSPKFYVGTNLPAGTVVSLALVGKPGSLVNRLSFQKQFSAAVGENHLAVFERLEDEGKPLPMGEYEVKVSAEGATPLAFDRFMGGRKSAVYQDRLKKYKDKLQGEYDKEMQELREMIDTLKQLNADVVKKLADAKAAGNTPALRTRLLGDWKSFSAGAQSMLTQLDQKLKARAAAGGATYQPRAFEDVASTLAQLQHLVVTQGKRLEGGGAAVAAGTLEDIESTVSAGITSLEASLAQALVKSPFDVLGTKGGQHGGAAIPAAPPAPAPVPAAAPAADSAPAE